MVCKRPPFLVCCVGFGPRALPSIGECYSTTELHADPLKLFLRQDKLLKVAQAGLELSILFPQVPE